MDVNFKENVQVFGGILVDEIHYIFATPGKYNKMTDSCSSQYVTYDELFIPIVKIIEHIFEKNKHTGLENFP